MTHMKRLVRKGPLDATSILVQKLHLENMLSYAEKMVKMTPKEELKQDLEQLFLVIVNEKYKNAQLSHLRTVVWGGLSATVLILIIAGVIFALT